MADKLPWFPFFAGDWMNDGKRFGLTWAQQGMYIFLLSYQWREGSIPGDKASLMRILSLTETEFDESWPMLGACFEQCSSIAGAVLIVNSRLEEVRKKQVKTAKKASKKASDAAKARWRQPVIADAPSNAQAMLESCHSESESELEQEKKKSIENTKVFSRQSAKRTDWDVVMNLWNHLAEQEGRPKITLMSDTRKDQYRTRLRKHPDFWDILEKELPLLGDFARNGGWLTWDWLIKSPNNIVKLSEGQYRDNGRGGQQGDYTAFKERLDNLTEEDLDAL